MVGAVAQRITSQKPAKHSPEQQSAFMPQAPPRLTHVGLGGLAHAPFAPQLPEQQSASEVQCAISCPQQTPAGGVSILQPE